MFHPLQNTQDHTVHHARPPPQRPLLAASTMAAIHPYDPPPPPHCLCSLPLHASVPPYPTGVSPHPRWCSCSTYCKGQPLPPPLASLPLHPSTVSLLMPTYFTGITRTIALIRWEGGRWLRRSSDLQGLERLSLIICSLPILLWLFSLFDFPFLKKWMCQHFLTSQGPSHHYIWYWWKVRLHPHMLLAFCSCYYINNDEKLTWSCNDLL